VNSTEQRAGAAHPVQPNLVAPAGNDFSYITNDEALNLAHAGDPNWRLLSRAVHVSHIPTDLLWGLKPLGWTYHGHDVNYSHGNNDYWAPPGATHIRARLQIPRDRLCGQITMTLLVHVTNTVHRAPDHSPHMFEREANAWQVTVTTRTELNTALRELHEIAANPDTLAAFIALRGLTAAPYPEGH
jgi:hypothetical protein